MSLLQKYVDEVCPPADRDEDDEVFAGVGFGPNFYRLVGGNKAKHNFTYPHRKGYLGEMPSSGEKEATFSSALVKRLSANQCQSLCTHAHV